MPKSPILILTGSARALRRSPAIAHWVADVGRARDDYPYQVVDVRDLGLTLDDEPELPAHGRYIRETTRAWSAQVTSCAGLVVVTPQYNWGYPAPLKNALDHLYAEWRGKPAALVTYGGHGGGKCAAQLRQVMEGALKMRMAATQPELTLPGDAIQADDGRVDPDVTFADRRSDVAAALAELSVLIEAAPVSR